MKKDIYEVVVAAEKVGYGSKNAGEFNVDTKDFDICKNKDDLDGREYYTVFWENHCSHTGTLKLTELYAVIYENIYGEQPSPQDILEVKVKKAHEEAMDKWCKCEPEDIIQGAEEITAGFYATKIAGDFGKEDSELLYSLVYPYDALKELIKEHLMGMFSLYSELPAEFSHEIRENIADYEMEG